MTENCGDLATLYGAFGIFATEEFFLGHVWPPEGSNFVVSMFQQSKPLPLMRKFIPYRLWFDTPTDDWDSKELTCFFFWSC